MAHWVEGDDNTGYTNNKSSYVNLDVMSSIWAQTVSGVTYLKCVDANNITYTLANSYANSADALAELANLTEGFTAP